MMDAETTEKNAPELVRRLGKEVIACARCGTAGRQIDDASAWCQVCLNGHIGLMIPRTERATAALNILTRHAVKAAFLAKGTDDEVIVVCRCDLRFDAGESHSMHQTGQLDQAGMFA